MARALCGLPSLAPSLNMCATSLRKPADEKHHVQLFDRWCTEEKNSILIPGYSVEGTLAKKIQSSPDEVTGMDGRVRQLRSTVEYISFSAHVDFVQNKSFIDGVEVNELRRRGHCRARSRECLNRGCPRLLAGLPRLCTGGSHIEI